MADEEDIVDEAEESREDEDEDAEENEDDDKAVCFNHFFIYLHSFSYYIYQLFLY
ncbi:unnamed protein product [Wuchereria bancrofti]|uniref:Uncharacterized protein n=1 Tax=Wuchereria bancrofti TaxID=6293 RepID=A0A3P7DL24_WUCBA|nr:unnamed protein product [Wuchereria bancrofti]